MLNAFALGPVFFLICTVSPFASGQTIGRRSAVVQPDTARALVLDDITRTIRDIKTSRAAKPKGEFETTTDYAARKADFPLGGRSYNFSIGVAEFAYDADRRKMRATIPCYRAALDDDRWAIGAKTVPLQTTTYMGENSFGVKRLITSRIYDAFGIVQDESSLVKFGTTGEVYSTETETKFEWSMDLAAAQALKPYLLLAVSGQVTSPEVLEDIRHTSPTITNPIDSNTRLHRLRFSVSEIHVLDGRSGRIMVRLDNRNLIGAPSEATTPPFDSGLLTLGNPSLSALPSTDPAILSQPRSNEQSETRPTPEQLDVAQTKGNIATSKPVRQDPKLASDVKPSYPPLARAARVQGVIRIEAMIAKDGTVQNLKLLSGPPLLVQAAFQAVQQWRYVPALLNGEPVEALVVISLEFLVESDGKPKINYR